MIAIIGAGISGLTLAYHLQQAGKPFVLLESAPHTGGYLHSLQIGKYVLDAGANSVLCDAETEDFFLSLGLEHAIVTPNAVSKARYIYRGDGYKVLPSGPVSMLFGSYFSWKSKWAIMREPGNKTTSPANETLSQFFERRFSKEIVDYALAPFVSGIYAGDPNKLLVNKTFPSLLAYEQQYGSVLKGFIKNVGASRKKSLNFDQGMQTLTRALEQKIDKLYLSHKVTKICRTQSGWQLALDTPVGHQTIDVTQIVLTVPAFVAQTLLQEIMPELSAALSEVDYPPLAVVHTVYQRNQVKFHLNGFGGLHPHVEKLYTSGSIWTSSVFKGRCPADEVLFTSFVGGALGRDKAQESEETIGQKVHTELKRLYGISSEKPVFQHVTKWPKVIPQYDAALNKVYPLVDALEKEQIYVCANWKDGISVTDCIKKAQALAATL